LPKRRCHASACVLPEATPAHRTAAMPILPWLIASHPAPDRYRVPVTQNSLDRLTLPCGSSRERRCGLLKMVHSSLSVCVARQTSQPGDTVRRRNLSPSKKFEATVRRGPHPPRHLLRSRKWCVPSSACVAAGDRPASGRHRTSASTNIPQCGRSSTLWPRRWLGPSARSSRNCSQTVPNALNTSATASILAVVSIALNW
jgi:hypothetical protein